MKRLEFNVKFIVVLLIAAGLVVGFISNEKQSSSIKTSEEKVLDIKVAFGK